MDTKLTEELSRVAKEILSASHRLQKEFANLPAVETSDGQV